MRESAAHYLETIFRLEQNLDKIRSIDIVRATGFSKPSISIAMKKLQSEGFIYVKKNGEIILTDIGRKQTIQILERHAILLQLFTLFGIPSNIAKKDAYKVEHVIQKETFLKIKEFLDKQY